MIVPIKSRPARYLPLREFTIMACTLAILNFLDSHSRNKNANSRRVLLPPLEMHLGSARRGDLLSLFTLAARIQHARER